MLQAAFTDSSGNKADSLWREEIILRLERAKSEALPIDEYQALKKKQNKLFASIKKSGKPEDVGQLLDIEDTLDKARLHFYTLPEFRFALEHSGCSPRDLPKILAHQNACANIADKSLTARTLYMIELSKSSPGHPQPYQGHCSVRVFHRDDWLADEIRKVENRVRNAPKNYGLKLSSDEMTELNMLHPLSFSF